MKNYLLFQTILTDFYAIFKLSFIKNSKEKRTPPSRKTTLVKKNYSSQKKMNFIYQNEATLDKKNNFTIDISEKKNFC